MPSVFLWIDDSQQQRQRMDDALGAFRVRSTRDELGLSVIRDAFSDLLFPGTGSVQTRAAYFLFVPWMYQRLEEEKVRSAEIVRVAERRELELISILLSSDDAEGTIGKRSGHLLKRLPSSVYWTGLGRLRICRFQRSQDRYHRSLDEWYRRRQGAARVEDGNVAPPPSPNWHPGLPKPPADWPRSASLRLRQTDAAYLRECIRTEAGSSLLAWMDGRVTLDDPGFVWDHPAVGELGQSSDAPSRALVRQVMHAKCFSEAMNGASILYNLIVARQVPQGGALVERYEQMMNEWHARVRGCMSEIRAWDLADLWRLMLEARARVRQQTIDFVTNWVSLVRAGRFEDATTSEVAVRLISLREQRLKGKLARIDNAEVQQRWEGDSGLGRLDFRWANARTLLADIADGLNGGAHARA